MNLSRRMLLVLLVPVLVLTVVVLMIRTSRAGDEPTVSAPAPRGTLVPRPDPNAPPPTGQHATGLPSGPGGPAVGGSGASAPVSANPASATTANPTGGTTANPASATTANPTSRTGRALSRQVQPTRRPTTTTPTLAAPRAVPAPQRTAEVLRGQDISWPQCRKGLGRGKGMPIPDTVTPGLSFSVIGVNQGSPFNANPCLAKLVAHARAKGHRIGAYTLPAPPTAQELTTFGRSGPYPSSTRSGRVRNVGHAQAMWTADNMRAAGLDARFMWLDVEELFLRTWKHTPAGQRDARDVIAGMQAGFRVKGIDTGFYSYGYGWKQITGGLRSDSPVWFTVAKAGWSGAAAGCQRASWSGGPVVMSQWYTGRMDFNVTCPAMDRHGGLDRFFTR